VRSWGGWVLGAVLAAALWSPAAPARAQLPELGDEPALIEADELRYDRELGVVTATGSVEIVQGERVLLADTVSYSENTGVVTATGNVSLMDASGDVVFADYVELDEGMRNGVIRSIRILMQDGSRFAANGARRTGGRVTEMSKGVYSPCELCPEDPDRPPLWQIKAVRIVHDQEEHDVAYYDATLELFGVPIGYTPYFSHPDPTVKRRTGFLTPGYGTASNLGTFIEIPYFFVLAPNRDFTFTPTFTTDEGAIFEGEYRERTLTGQYALSGSITRPDRRDDDGVKLTGKDTRGHVFANGLFRVDEGVRTGFQVERASDDTYLRRYDISEADTLTTRLLIDAMRGHDYALFDSYAFQGLQENDDSDQTPYVLPVVDVNLQSDRTALGSYATIDANLMNLSRRKGTQSRRLSVAGGWHLPYVAPMGDVYEFTASLRGDLYDADNVPDPSVPGSTLEGVSGRVVPLMALRWRYPFIRPGENVSQLIEPIVVGVVSPYGGNPDGIPNEDSTDFEFSDLNLFKTDRFPGLDRVEGGPRVAYGLKLGVFGNGGGSTTALIGQSYRVKDDSTFAIGSGLENNFSDYVGAIDIAPTSTLSLAYRFRLDGGDFRFRRNEVEAALGPPRLRFAVGYVAVDDKVTDVEEQQRREEVNTSATVAIADHWITEGFARYDLTGVGWIAAGGGISYQDECILLGIRVKRRFTEDRDAQPETSVLFVVKLLNLG